MIYRLHTEHSPSGRPMYYARGVLPPFCRMLLTVEEEWARDGWARQRTGRLLFGGRSITLSAEGWRRLDAGHPVTRPFLVAWDMQWWAALAAAVLLLLAGGWVGGRLGAILATTGLLVGLFTLDLALFGMRGGMLRCWLVWGCLHLGAAVWSLPLWTSHDLWFALIYLTLISLSAGALLLATLVAWLLGRDEERRRAAREEWS